ncbi:MAG: ATP-dependent DNA helicase, partial [Abditibacteriota bacterium]|nr:ATP-dependent DNA helicase [Abditibacteriota bacterium]
MHDYNPHGDIARIFTELFPAHGMAVREGQIALSHQFLDALLDKDIALCDAGTGTGKTYAYLVASVVFQIFSQAAGLPFQPIIISTSSITLQKAILADYVPFVSNVLLKDGIIPKPLRAVIRKGKSHYLCDDRLLWRLRELKSGKNNADYQQLKKLLNSSNVQETDELKPFEQRLLGVPVVCDCGRKRCRYRDFVEQSNREAYTFQICNHNLLLADATHRDTGRRPVLPDG